MQERQASWPCLTVRGCDHLAKSRAPALPYAILFSSRRDCSRPRDDEGFRGERASGARLKLPLEAPAGALALRPDGTSVPAPLRPVFQRHLPNEGPRVPRDIALAPQA